MIKTQTVAICDICGFCVQAKVVGSQYNEYIYGPPDGWGKGVDKNVLICPACLKKLQIPCQSGQTHERSAAHV